MAQFWEFFSFELRFRLKSVSTYVYFALWFFLSFLAIAAEDFLSTGNDKILLNGSFSTSILYIIITFFGVIVIAAIFGSSILRDFQRDTYQLVFTKPISKFAYLGGRWAGSFVTSVFCFSGLVFGEAAGTLAPWADHTRIVHGHFGWYVHAFLAIPVVQIFFLGSLFFTIAALTRKLFIVYLQGVVFFVVYLVVNVIFQATGSLEHFWSAIFDPVGLRLFDSITRYCDRLGKEHAPAPVVSSRCRWNFPVQPPTLERSRPYLARRGLQALPSVRRSPHRSLARSSCRPGAR